MKKARKVAEPQNKAQNTCNSCVLANWHSIKEGVCSVKTKVIVMGQLSCEFFEHYIPF